MAATAYGDAHVVFGQNTPVITMYLKDGSALSGYVNPELAEATLETVFEAQNYTNLAGEVCARRTKGAYIRATFQVIPKDSGSSISDALAAATVPGEGMFFTIGEAGGSTVFKTIKAYPFTDAFNCTKTTSPWFVESGSIRGSAQDVAGVTFTAVRFPGITSGTPVAE